LHGGRNVNYITIQKEADISESPEYLRIKQENQILQTETVKHIVERSELQELRAEIEKMKEFDHEFQKISAQSLDFNDPAIKAQLLKFLNQS